MTTLYRPDLLYADGRFVANSGLLVDDAGFVSGMAADAPGATVVELPGRALLPGFVNAHSHSFQRLIRGKSESRARSGRNFWSWRGTMYHAAASLSPEEIYDVARMAFLEMVLAGTTTVGEFHYVHNAPDGRPYDDANLLARQVMDAARSVQLRIVLLRCAYFRAGYQLPPDPGQARFYESPADFLENMEALFAAGPDAANVHFGVAPHSLRAVPLDNLQAIAAWAREHRLPLHMHVSEQVAENEACLREYGATPVTVLAREGLLGGDFTAVHATHISAEETAQLADGGATICACPTTERNLGDGILGADAVFRAGIRVALGSDSQAQIDPLEDARQLEYHLRLRDQQRVLLDQIDGQPIAQRLFACATRSGARALGLPAGELTPGRFADFFTVDLRDVSIAGHSPGDLLPLLVFGLNRAAIRDVAVAGRLVLRDGRHPLHDAIVTRYQEIHERVWRDSDGGAR